MQAMKEINSMKNTTKFFMSEEQLEPKEETIRATRL
jgi:hypothetical protein